MNLILLIFKASKHTKKNRRTTPFVLYMLLFLLFFRGVCGGGGHVRLARSRMNSVRWPLTSQCLTWSTRHQHCHWMRHEYTTKRLSGSPWKQPSFIKSWSFRRDSSRKIQPCDKLCDWKWEMSYSGKCTKKKQCQMQLKCKVADDKTKHKNEK